MVQPRCPYGPLLRQAYPVIIHAFQAHLGILHQDVSHQVSREGFATLTTSFPE